MAQTVSVIVGTEDCARLIAVLGDRNRPLKHVQRAKIVLLSAERLPVLEVAHRAGVCRSAVWRWQVRYAGQGVDGLLRDKTRKPGRARLSTATVARVLALTCSEPPGAVTHWTGRAMARAVGISLRAVQRIWPTTRAESSISRPSLRPGSMPLRASSRPSPASASGAAFSGPWLNFRTLSPATSRRTTRPPSTSSGPSPPTRSWLSSPGFLNLPNESKH